MKAKLIEMMKNRKKILNDLYASKYNNTLTEYVKTLDDNTLAWLYTYLIFNEINDNMLHIYEVVLIEVEYRTSQSENITKVKHI